MVQSVGEAQQAAPPLSCTLTSMPACLNRLKLLRFQFAETFSRPVAQLIGAKLTEHGRRPSTR
eukprot:SAG22_NODE_3095_length_1946_cov_1.397401_1_plen_62_part_10